MQSRRKMILIAVGVVIGLMFLGAVALVVMGFIQFREVETELKASRSSLEMLYSQKPFPSMANAKQEMDNIQTIQQELLDLQTAMGAEQVEPEGQSPAKFVTQFFETKKRLESRAKAQNITLATDFSFGRHMKGDLPASQDVPRLTQQLRIVETLCDLLFSSHITSLGGIARQEFEADAVGTGGTPPRAPVAQPNEIEIKNVVDAMAGIIPQGQQYGRWHFALQFNARDTVVMNILNGLASSGVFISITRLDIKGDEKLFERKDSAGAGLKPEAAPAEEGVVPVKEVPKMRDERIVCGRDSALTVKMELDVYQFAKNPAVTRQKPRGE